MRVPYWLNFLSSRRRAGPARPVAAPRRPFRPTLEALCDRCLPSFSPIIAYTGANPQMDASADFNGDGRLDLVMANSDHSPSVLLGNGDGTFRASGYSFGGVPSVAVGDFNGDGKPDLVALFGGQDGVAVALGNGDGNFQTAQVAYAGMTPTSVVVGDLNGDGKLDLVTTAYSAWSSYDPYTGNSYGGSAGYANVLIGNGDGTFVLRDSYSLDYYTSGSSSALGDFNGDGTLDLAADGSVFLGNGDGTLRARQSTPMWAAAAADVNADGKLDLVGNGVALGNGDGTFQPARLYEATGPSVRVADFDGDGRPDLAAETPGNFLAVQLGNGDGTFRDAYHFAAGSGPSLAVGDFNGDRRPDAVTADWSAGGTVTVQLNDGNWAAPPDPTLSIGDVRVAEGNTGTTAATFTLTLSAASDRDVTVDYATADLTPGEESWYGPGATAGSDYQAAAGTLTFAAGETTKTITVAVNGDRVAEADESFLVNLSNPTNAFVVDAVARGIIVDDEPSVSIEPYVSGVEGNTGTTPFTFTVTLSAAYDAPVTVGYATADPPPDWGVAGATAGADYQAAAGTLTFAAGETTKTITVLVNGDRVGEGDESFVVNLSNPTSARLDSSGSQAVGTIVDDESRVSIGWGGTVVEGNSGTTNVTFTVTLSAASDAPVAVTYATADGSATAGSDYVATAGTLTFAAGQTTKTFTVAVKGDRVGEGNEYFYVNLTGATGALIDTGSGSATILDDEPRISVNSVSVAEGNSGTTVMTFTVTLSAAYDQAVTVNYATHDGSATVADGDYVATSGTLTFAPGQTSKTFTVVIKGDKQKEADESFYVLLSGASTNAFIDTATGWGTILNDDGPGKIR